VYSNSATLKSKLRVTGSHCKRHSDLDMWVRGHSMSLKMVPLKSLRMVSYLPTIVTMGLSCIVC